MNATAAIGYTLDGAAYCPDHKPACDCAPDDPGHVEPGAIFADQSSEWEDGGLTCDRCYAVIVESDTCRACDRSLRDDHDEYTYGGGIPGTRGVRADQQCRPHGAATILVRDAFATWSEVVPFDIERYAAPDAPLDPVGALDAIVAAYAGRVMTFDLQAVERIEATY